jgi:hypothetical protein
VTQGSRVRALPLAIDALGLAMLLLTWRLGRGGLFLLIAFAAAIAAGEFFCRLREDGALTPYMPLVLSPLLLVRFSSVLDFRIRLACLFMLAYILAWAWRAPVRRRKISLAQAGPARVWLLSFLVFALAASVFYARGIHLSGDEPHYVMIAQSLAEDGDFDLRNNLESRSYFAYLPVEIQFHGSVQGGKFHSFHLPGVSFLLLPFYLLFRLLAGVVPAGLYFRLVAAFISAFFALGLFQVMKALWPEEDNSAAFLFFLAGFPLLFHAIHLFPELPAATLLIYAYLFSRGERRNLLLAGILLAGIPWFHLKYVLPMLILALAVTAGVWRRRAGGREKILDLSRFFLPQAIGASLLMVYSRLLYGSFNPGVISPEKNFFAIPLWPKVETLLSFFLDQRDGLLVYAPVFVLLFLVCKKETRSRIRDFWLLGAIFLSYVLLHAFTTVRGGYSPAARPTVFVLWIMAVFLVAHYRQAGEAGRTLFRLLAGLGFFSSAWILYYPLFLYQPVTREVSQRASSLLLFLGSKAVDLSAVFPSFLKKPNAGYLPDWLWLAGLAITFALYYASPRRRDMAKPARLAVAALGLPMLLFICGIPHVQLQARYSAAGISFFNNSRNFTPGGEAGSFKVRAGQDYDLFIDLQGSAADRLDLRLLNPMRVPFRIRNGRRTLLAENHDAEARVTVPLRALTSFTLGRRRLVHLGLESGSGPDQAFFWLEFRG